jgi:hypothetical protein
MTQATIKVSVTGNTRATGTRREESYAQGDPGAAGASAPVSELNRPAGSGAGQHEPDPAAPRAGWLAVPHIRGRA